MLSERTASASAATRRVFEGADIDAYRQRYGKAEGERRFFAEQQAALEAPEFPDRAPYRFEDEIGPFDSVYLDTTQF